MKELTSQVSSLKVEACKDSGIAIRQTEIKLYAMTKARTTVLKADRQKRFSVATQSGGITCLYLLLQPRDWALKVGVKDDTWLAGSK